MLQHRSNPPANRPSAGLFSASAHAATAGNCCAGITASPHEPASLRATTTPHGANTFSLVMPGCPSFICRPACGREESLHRCLKAGLSSSGQLWSQYQFWPGEEFPAPLLLHGLKTSQSLTGIEKSGQLSSCLRGMPPHRVNLNGPVRTQLSHDPSCQAWAIGKFSLLTPRQLPAHAHSILPCTWSCMLWDAKCDAPRPGGSLSLAAKQLCFFICHPG